MKQVKISDVKEVLNCANNNEFVAILLGLYNTRILNAHNAGDDDIEKFYNHRWIELYNLLDNVGYYDKFKNDEE